MPAGGGKYGPECDEIIRKYAATGVILLVYGGTKGEGFSVATTTLAFQKAIPQMLRSMADAIDAMSK